MPKRIVDGEGIWRSDKLVEVNPPQFRAELANLLPLSHSNGTFECAARKVWATVYAYNRADMDLEAVEALLNELERVKILFRWDDEDGKQWGQFIGVTKPGRLPPPSERNKEKRGAEVPLHKLAEFLDVPVETILAEPTASESQGTPGLPGRYQGNGSGNGKAKGKGSGKVKESLLIAEPNTRQVSSDEETKTDLNSKDKNNDPTPALELARYFYSEVSRNPAFKHAPPNWEECWTSDFEKLLESYGYARCEQIIDWSQSSRWRKYVIRPLVLLEKAAEIDQQLAHAAKREKNSTSSHLPISFSQADNKPDEFDPSIWI